MDTLQKAVLIAHTLIALLIIVLVLLQRGKGADAGAAFGAGSSGTVFGARGSGSFFSRMTAILATLFFISSLSLAYLSTQASSTGGSRVSDVVKAPEAEEPASIDDELPALPDEPAVTPDAELPALQDGNPDGAPADDAGTE